LKEILSTALKSPNSFVSESTSIAFNTKADFFNYNLIAKQTRTNIKNFYYEKMRMCVSYEWW